jgi:hypothetical protein
MLRPADHDPGKGLIDMHAIKLLTIGVTNSK